MERNEFPVGQVKKDPGGVVERNRKKDERKSALRGKISTPLSATAFHNEHSPFVAENRKVSTFPSLFSIARSLKTPFL